MERLILNLVSGTFGGNVVGRLIGSLNQGTIINSIAGILGGGLGGSILGMLGAPDMAGMAGDAVGWALARCWDRWPAVAVVGVYYWALVGFVRSKMG
jgi:hypothetical protein